MFSRKMNAVISLMTTACLFAHAISMAVWTLSSGTVKSAPAFIPRTLCGLMVIHAYISIDLAISAHMNVEKRPCKQYPKLNVSTMIQRISGVLMIIFTGLHIAGATGYLHPPKVIHAIVPLFFAVALAHVAVSVSKAFVTLGLGNARFIKAADVSVKILCGATFIADVVGFYLYFL